MKSRFLSLAIAAALVVGLTACSGCTQTGKLHAPTTTANVGVAALSAYALEGDTARQVLKQPACATPPVYPCIPQSVKDQVDRADQAAFDAAVAADAAGATQVQRDNAIEKRAELQRIAAAAKPVKS